jgi:hypothetical protein
VVPWVLVEGEVVMKGYGGVALDFVMVDGMVGRGNDDQILRGGEISDQNSLISSNPSEGETCLFTIKSDKRMPIPCLGLSKARMHNPTGQGYWPQDTP